MYATRARSLDRSNIDHAWLLYLVARLPRQERAKVSKLICAGKTPKDYAEHGGPPGEWK
jgi:hypothetical protein